MAHNVSQNVSQFGNNNTSKIGLLRWSRRTTKFGLLTPKMGQTNPLETGLSKFSVPEAKFVVQLPSCQSGLLWLCMPKFDPPTTSR